MGAIDAGFSHAEAARLFGVGPATITRWRQRHRERGHLVPSARPGRPRRLAVAQEAALREQVCVLPDATLVEHCAAWAAVHRIRLSQATLSRALAWIGWPLKKKSLIASERDEAARTTWREAVTALDPHSGCLVQVPATWRAPRIPAWAHHG